MDNVNLGTSQYGGELKISVCLNGILAEHIKKCVKEEGFYDNEGEYIRDLIRQDINKKQNLEGSLNIIWEHLAPGALADESEFEPLSINDIKNMVRSRKD